MTAQDAAAIALPLFEKLPLDVSLDALAILTRKVRDSHPLPDVPDDGGFYDMSGYAPESEFALNRAKQRDRIRENANRMAVQQAVKRCGPVLPTGGDV